MFIDQNIKKFVMLSSWPITEALKKTSNNGVRVAYCVSAGGHLEGIVTDGDLKRWIVNDNKLDSETLVSQIANKDFLWANNQDQLLISNRSSHKRSKFPFSTSIEGSKRLHLTSQIKLELVIGWFPLHPPVL